MARVSLVWNRLNLASSLHVTAQWNSTLLFNNILTKLILCTVRLSLNGSRLGTYAQEAFESDRCN